MSYLKTVANKYPKHIIQEAGFSRMMQHIKGLTGASTFGIISAFREELSKKENLQRNQQLKDILRANDLGFMEQKGNWAGVEEISLFVPNIDEDLLLELGEEFEQYAVVFGQVDEEDDSVLIDVVSNGEVDTQDFLLTDENAIAQFISDGKAYGYSEKDGRKYVLGKKDEFYPKDKTNESLNESLNYFEPCMNSLSANTEVSYMRKVLNRFDKYGK